MSPNCDDTVIFPIYSQFGTIRKPDSGCIVCKTYIFINSYLLSYKNWKQNNWFFCKKIYADISKIKGALVLKGIFSETTYVCTYVLNFQVSWIILTSLRQRGNFTPHLKTNH